MFIKKKGSFCLKAKGFTLVEMAIVLVIVGLLISGLIVPLAAQNDLRGYRETREKIATIKEAVIGFAIVNGRLPCPADGTIASGLAGAGSEDCTLAAGIVPWAALGIHETDAWGRRFTYQVTQLFSDGSASTHGCVTPPSALPDTSFSLCSPGDITITNSAVAIATNIPVLIVSHGKNGFGAYLPTGAKLPDASATADEQDNADVSVPPDFVSIEPNVQGFDDVVDWVSPNILSNRMVTAGKLP